MVISANKGKISGKGKVSSKTARTREHQNSAKKRDDLGAREDLGEKGKKSADGALGEQGKISGGKGRSRRSRGRSRGQGKISGEGRSASLVAVSSALRGTRVEVDMHFRAFTFPGKAPGSRVRQAARGKSREACASSARPMSASDAAGLRRVEAVHLFGQEEARGVRQRVTLCSRQLRQPPAAVPRFLRGSVRVRADGFLGLCELFRDSSQASGGSLRVQWALDAACSSFTMGATRRMALHTMAIRAAAAGLSLCMASGPDSPIRSGSPCVARLGFGFASCLL